MARPDIIRLDGQLPAAPVHQHRQFDAPGPPVIDEGVQRRPDGAAGEQHVVHQHHLLVVNGPRQFRLAHQGLMAELGPVVPVEGDIQHPHPHRPGTPPGNVGGQPLGQKGAAGPDAHQHQFVLVLMVRHDLIGKPLQGLVQFAGAHV